VNLTDSSCGSVSGWTQLRFAYQNCTASPCVHSALRSRAVGFLLKNAGPMLPSRAGGVRAANRTHTQVHRLFERSDERTSAPLNEIESYYRRMERAAIFVDAGYYYAQGSYATFGILLKRHELVADEEMFLKLLGDAVSGILPSNCEVLRTYWYDGAQDGSPSPQHLIIGSLPRVKLRLGRINREGQQKGVDTLIVRDLMVLSQERSITHAFVLSGDEDLREGVAYAQDRGVCVGLLGIHGARGTSQSRELAREADIVLNEQATNAAKQSLTRADPSSADHAHSTKVISAGFDCRIVVRQFVGSWRSTASESEITELVAARPILPGPLDGHLLREVSKLILGEASLDEQQKRDARKTFWEEMTAPSPEVSEP